VGISVNIRIVLARKSVSAGVVGSQGPSAGRHGSRGVFVGVACAEARSRQGKRRPNPSTSYRRGSDYAKGPVIQLEIPRERLIGLTVLCLRIAPASGDNSDGVHPAYVARDLRMHADRSPDQPSSVQDVCRLWQMWWVRRGRALVG